MKSLTSLPIIAFYYIGWFGSLYLAKTELAWASIGFPLALIAYLQFRGLIGIRLVAVGMAITGIGVLFDSAMAHLEFISIVGQSTTIIPLWLISIWLLFAFSMVALRNVMRFSYRIAAVLGAIVGPLSYRSGEYFQVLSMASETAIVLYAVFWAIAFPAIIYFSRRLA